MKVRTMWFSPDIVEQYGSQGLIGWVIIFYAVWLVWKLVKHYNDSGFGDF